MPSQSLVQVFCLAFTSHVLVQFRPVALAVVFDLRMNEFMQDDIVHQVAGQCDKIDVQIDIVEMRATTPSTPLVPHSDPIVGEAMLPCQFLEPVLKHGLGCGLGYFGCVVKGILMFAFYSSDIVQVLLSPSQILMEKRLGPTMGNAWRKCHSDGPEGPYGDGNPLGPFGLGKGDWAQMCNVEFDR